MNFKRLELNGFKSFADPVTIEFPGGITCIVGPNGSGKSNISDAIRWVLGEQSPKTLRGGRMEDVIFAGTQNRKPKGMAEVTLVIDNSDHMLPIDYAEVGITRRMYRSGESEYLINNNICRLKDIRELIMDTGICVEGYSVIGQGRIVDIIENKMDSRREIFEEAAGITKYKTKKLESERKLERTSENLTRVNDIVREIEGRIGSLERESKKASEYLEIKDKYRDVEINIILNNINSACSKTDAVKEEIGEIEKLIASDEQEKIILDNTIRANKEKLNELEADLEKLRASLLAKNDEIHSISGRGEVNRERLESLGRDKERLASEIKQIDEKTLREEENLRNAQAVLASAKEEEAALDADYRKKHDAAIQAQIEKDNVNRQLQEKKLRIFDLSTSISAEKASAESYESLKQTLKKRSEKIEENRNLADVRSELEDRHRRALKDKALASEIYTKAGNSADAARVSVGMLKARYTLLDELEKSYEGYGGGVKFIMGRNLPGIVGTLGDLLEVPRGYELAIETVLGGKLQNIVCTDDDVAKKAIGLLKANKAGRLTFLPVDNLRVNSPMDVSEIENDKGFRGLASDLVSIKGGYQEVVEYMLGNVVIVDSIDHAIAIYNRDVAPYKIVTLEGEVINASGAVTGGSFKNNTSNILSRKTEKADIKKSLKQSEEDLVRFEKQRDEAQKSLAAAEEERIRTENEISNTDSKIVELSDIEKAIANAERCIEPALERITALERMKSKADKELSVIIKQSETADTEFAESKEAETRARMAQNAAELKSANAKEFAALAEKNLKELAEDRITKERQIESASIQEKQIIDFEGTAGEVLSEKEAEKAEIEKSIEALTLKKNTASEESEKIEAEKHHLDKQLYEHQTKKHDADVRMARFDSQTETLKEKLFDEFEMSYAEACEHEDPDFVMSTGLKLSREFKDRLRALGNVNVGSIEEYKNVKERYDFLREQREDINQAMAELNRVIKEMDAVIKSRFQESFDSVAENFEKTFSELFKGGHARLSMEDPSNPLETTIEIEAQPPGKKLQNMNLLSGGEKTVTAIALMFAVLKSKPTPFCILDEIEAALDETNIDGVIRYIKGFDATQFALVTHQKLTMEYADALYGVTMPEKGVSKVLSLRLGDEFEVE